MITKIINAKVICDDQIKTDVNVYFENGFVTAITEKELPFDEKIDAKGNYLSAGFIDIHTHGGGNSDFMDGGAEAFVNPAVAHAKHGTTALFPTVTSGSFAEINQSCSDFRKAKELEFSGARLMGVHLEGPYFAMSQKGAQDPKYVRNPEPQEYIKILNSHKDVIKRWSAAPELKGAFEFAKVLKQNGILASMGHTEVDCIGAKEAMENGFAHITHLYSCTAGVTRKNAFRYAGLNEAAFLYDDLTFEIIADGCHLPKELLQFIYKLKSPDKVALVTDSIRAAGFNCNESIIGSKENGMHVIIEDDVAKLPDRTAFAGSIATMDRLVRNMVNMGGASLTDAVKMATKTPAKIMGLSEMGEIKEGFVADFVVFDENINVKQTIVKGKTIYKN